MKESNGIKASIAFIEEAEGVIELPSLEIDGKSIGFRQIGSAEPVMLKFICSKNLGREL